MADFVDLPGYAVTATGVLGVEKRSASDTVTGYATAQAIGTWTSLTVQCEGTNDNSTWVALQLTNLNSGATGTGITATGIYRADVGGVHRYRWNCSVFSSATGAKLYPSVREG